MEVRLLGPVGVFHPDGEVPLARTQQRCVLAVLAINPGQVVSRQTLIDCVWGTHPPPSAAHSLHAQVSRLRRALAGAGGGRSLIRRGDGYRLEIDQDHIDLHRGRRLAAEARTLRGAGHGQAARVAERLRAACALWRGTPLAGLGGDWADRVRVGLGQERLALFVDRYRAELALGEDAALIGPLSALLVEYPLAEPLAGLLMVALYRGGRQAEALEVYGRTRRRLIDEIGDEPGAELRAVHDQVLHRDPRLDPPDRDRAAPEPVGHPRAAQLPADVPGFVGRDGCLRRLDALLTGGDAPAATIVAVVGPGGIGKTALAVHWAHRVRDRFPDGQLYANLRGFSPEPPLRPAQVLAYFLRALGVPPERVPVDVDEAAALYRSLLADRRMVVVIDNAGSVDDVRPLLPGRSGCVALVTSRHHLAGLVARDGAVPVALDVLRPAESKDLLAELLGAGRVAAEPEPVTALAELCGHLPLALRIAAANLTTRPHRSIDSYRITLAQGNRLTALAVAGDEQAAVRAAFALSYARLGESTRRLFRLLGLVPGPDITAEGAAALAGTNAERAGGQLAELAAAHLIDEHVPQRYALHDLLRLFAAERAEAEDAEPDRTAARNRLFRWYLRRAYAAGTVLYADLTRLAPPADAGPAEPPMDATAAWAWLDAERACLVASAAHLAEHGPTELGWRLADALRGYFYLRSDPTDWLSVGQAGITAAEAGGSALGQAAARLCVSTFHWHHSRYPQAIVEAERALDSFREAGWRRGEVSVLNVLGNSTAQAGHIDRAIEHYQRALAVDRQDGGAGEPTILGNLAAAYGQRGDLARVIDHATRAAELSRRSGLHLIEADHLRLLGDAHHLLGEYALARELLGQARGMARRVEHSSSEANALRGLAAVHRDLGENERALELADLALALLNGGGHPLLEADCLAVKAGAQGREDHAAALGSYRRALRLAHRFGNRYPEAECLIGLATLHQCAGDYEPGREYAERALAITQEAGFRLLEGQALTVLAATRLGYDDPGQARQLGERALLIHRETGHRLGEARTQLVLAGARDRAGDPAAAEHRSAAAALFAALGVPAGDPG